MNEKDLLEAKDQESLEREEKTSKPYRGNKKSIVCYVGIALNFILMLLSGISLTKGVFIGGGGPVKVNDGVASIISGSGNLALPLLILSLVCLALFIFMLVRKDKNGR
ncbi:hypothetical protein [Eubacterium xylanophilum]|uniref:hypothetical protein n=1 Tax=Eubacterium xylanophilum TaxID=39497 RepID=UPI00047B89E7|nr:hypothetical protein [Eubacterium xylanophilum]